MAYFAKLDENNLVVEVLRVDDTDCLNNQGTEEESVGIEFLRGVFGESTRWAQTSFNSNIRRRHASVGGQYNAVLDVFIEPKPSYESWSLDGLGDWHAPVAKPETTESIFWDWNEGTQSWDQILMEGPAPV